MSCCCGHGLQIRAIGFYVHFKGASEQSIEEKNLQKEIAEKGKINEINGKD
ncbi:Zoocin A [Flavobacterium anhuiense]|uniref:Zoocin A n=1 Tax=Flavobacterium anhuiense TaxID=459526 RepID=A0A444VYA7_9FLAO|nr:Zoocin A [Flavobacterium anhuiense]